MTEPVAWQAKQGVHTQYLYDKISADYAQANGWKITPLYAHPAPAPAGVPDVAGLRESFPEINPSNYGEQEVMALNQWGLEAYDALAALLAQVKELRLDLEATTLREHKTERRQAERISELKAKLAEAVEALRSGNPDARMNVLKTAREVMG